jgi:intracellular septation protein
LSRRVEEAVTAEVDARGAKGFFLLSFVPAIAYWYLEANYSVRVALLGGLLLVCLELGGEWLVAKRIHSLSIFNGTIILVLGASSLWASDGLWFKLQPALTGVFVGAFLLVQQFRGRSLLIEMFEDLAPEAKRAQIPQKLRDELLGGIEIHIVVFLIGYGLFMAYVALHESTSRWLFFKTIGFYLACLVLAGFEFVWALIKIKRLARAQSIQANQTQHVPSLERPGAAPQDGEQNRRPDATQPSPPQADPVADEDPHS